MVLQRKRIYMRHTDVVKLASSPQRLKSLDVLRGFDMFFIMGGWQFVISACVALGFGDSCFLATQMKHVDWNGFHFCDFIFPLFLFIAGVTFPYSFAKQISSGLSLFRVRLRILRRALVLILLGFGISGFFASGGLHFGSILFRIGVAWAFAALLYTFFLWRKRVLVSAQLLLIYSLLLMFVGAPDYPDAGVYSPLGNISGWVDRMVFPPFCFAQEGPYYNQGFLGTIIAAPVTAMLGIFAGEMLRAENVSPSCKARNLFLIGLSILSIGLLAAFCLGDYSIPINKKLWTSSYVLVSGGCSFLILSIFYYLIDVKYWWKHYLFFTVIGVNSITIYVAQRFIDFRYTATFFSKGLVASVSESFGLVIADASYIAVCWIFLFLLYKMRVFIKV